jgi:transposase
VAADPANAQTRRAWLCFVDESGVKLTPPTRRTWAPKSHTPVLRHPYRRGKQISMCGLVAYRPGQDDRDEPAAWMGFDLREGAYDAGQFVRVLDGLGRQLQGQPVTVIWDNLGAHHAGDLHAWAATQPWLEVEYLPSYAPELDPVEGLWANLKGCELANRCCADRKELIATAQVGSIRVRVTRSCCAASWQGRASPCESPPIVNIRSW